jgi:CDP-diacylglycerol--serine O-phosphatidyltransferase
MLRSYTAADALTIGNASCGTISLFLCLNYVDTGSNRYIAFAFLLLPLALVFDILDGYVARAQKHRQSVLGGDLDSLADVISFGVAPAVLGFTLGLRGGWDMVCLTYFVVCGVSRLARFNVTAATLSDSRTGKVKYFEGTPIPTSVVPLGVLILAFHYGDLYPVTLFGAGLHLPVLLFLSAFLAIPGTVLVAYAYGKWSSKKSMVLFAVASIAGAAGLAIVEPTSTTSRAVTISVLALLYVASGGVSAMLSPYTAEVFPTRFRGTGSGVSAGATKLGGLVGGLATVTGLVTTATGFTGPVVLVSIPLAIAAILVAIAGLETRGRRLEELAGR